MLDFLINALYVMEGVAAVTSFIYIKKWKNTYWKWFPYYLVFIVLAEIIGTSFARHNMYIANFTFYSYLVIPVEFLFFFWVFHRALKSSKHRKMPVISSFIYMASLFSDILYFRHYQFYYYSLSYTIGNILLLILILIFFLQLVNSDKVLHFRQNILFWVSAGMLIYYLGSCPYYGLRNLLVYKYYYTINIYYSVFVYILNCLMYLSFSFGIICGKPNS